MNLPRLVPVCVILSGLVLTSGCLTAGVQRAIQKQKDVASEFTTKPCDGVIREGVLLGSGEMNGRKAFTVAFWGLLAGDPNRALQFVIPDGPGGGAILQDRILAPQTGRSMKLLVIQDFYANPDSWLLNARHDIIPFVVTESLLILNLHSPSSSDVNASGNGAWQLWIPGAGAYDKRGEWRVLPVENQISSLVRKPDKIPSLERRMLLTIPLDVVTAPIQFLGGFILSACIEFAN